MAKIVDPVQTAPVAKSDQDLQCFLMYFVQIFSLIPEFISADKD